MKVVYKDTDDNALQVERATYNTTNDIHVNGTGVESVSYTHLTLPTICSV